MQYLSIEVIEKIFAREVKEIQVLAKPSLNTGAKNELLFFYKPETFEEKSPEDFANIHEMVLDTFTSYGAEISGGFIFPGKSLEAHGIMNRHYGFINQLSTGISKTISPDEKAKMLSALGLSSEDPAPILGGHEFMQEFPAYNASQTNNLWLSKPVEKFRSGFYYQLFEAEGQKVIMVNGFHPKQLEHFTAEGKYIVVFVLETDAPWEDLKDKMVGNTFPDKAVPGSIRGKLFQNKDLYNTHSCSVSKNHVHLSAGPYESFFEIWNFLGSLEKDFDLSTTHVGASLIAGGYPAASLKEVLKNPEIATTTGSTDLFTASENMDTPAAVDLLLNQ